MVAMSGWVRSEVDFEVDFEVYLEVYLSPQNRALSEQVAVAPDISGRGGLVM